MNEQADIPTLQRGIKAGVEAMIAVAQTTIIQKAVDHGVDSEVTQSLVGFVTAVQDNRAEFENRILGKLVGSNA